MRYIETFTFLTIILLLASCNRDKQGASDEMAPMYPVLQKVVLNSIKGCKINPVTGDSIQPIVNSFLDTIKIGELVPVMGKAIHPDSVAQPKIIHAGGPKVVRTHLNEEFGIERFISKPFTYSTINSNGGFYENT
jgi:hypothetical protein